MVYCWVDHGRGPVRADGVVPVIPLDGGSREDGAVQRLSIGSISVRSAAKGGRRLVGRAPAATPELIEIRKSFQTICSAQWFMLHCPLNRFLLGGRTAMRDGLGRGPCVFAVHKFPLSFRSAGGIIV